MKKIPSTFTLIVIIIVLLSGTAYAYLGPESPIIPYPPLDSLV